MVLDETIQIPHYVVGWGSAPLLYSRVALLLCEAGRSVRQVPVSQQYWCKRISPSLVDRSRVELALLPRLSLTRLSRTQSLFLFGGSFVLYFLAPAGSATTKPLPARARIDRAGEAQRGWMSERLKESVLKTKVLIGILGFKFFSIREKLTTLMNRLRREGDLVLKKILPIQNDHHGKWTSNYDYEGPYVVKRAFSGGALLFTNVDGA
ncbi:conserved hypothetical protein [Ricinus communis]|uniref:Uncharacterized protein n=1 Tax=Ricinus communis TaxID=3988 RepID=B9S7V9_RICCO|nr:conserved hypothetical protein [Ricinus communis]